MTLPDEPIDADGYCLVCWSTDCNSFEECLDNRRRNRSTPYKCGTLEPHPSHDWQDGTADYFCRGKVAGDLGPW